MPFLSVIVPVYNVEEYLAECLDSVLAQSFDDFEIIVVNDCSPDRSAEIIDQYALQDPRVRVVTLQQNVGLGLARNAGLDVAFGDYVWFLDADDAITPGSMEAIVDRARATEADVVLFGLVYWFPDGGTKPNWDARTLREAPHVFSIADWPRGLDVSHAAWNKIIRRAFLAQLGLRFKTGWLEDIPFSFPLLAGASRIAAIDFPAVKYRQRSGSITKTADKRHLEVFDRWEECLAGLETFGRDPLQARSLMFPIISRFHLFTLLRTGRVPKDLRRHYLDRATAQLQQHFPNRATAEIPLRRRIELGLASFGRLWILDAYMRAEAVARWLVRGSVRAG